MRAQPGSSFPPNSIKNGGESDRAYVMGEDSLRSSTEPAKNAASGFSSSAASPRS